MRVGTNVHIWGHSLMLTFKSEPDVSSPFKNLDFRVSHSSVAVLGPKSELMRISSNSSIESSISSSFQNCTISSIILSLSRVFSAPVNFDWGVNVF